MGAYLQAIATKATGTRDAYRRILRDLSTWLTAKPGGAAGFAPDQLTQTAVTIYLEQLRPPAIIAAIAHGSRPSSVALPAF